MHSTSLIICVWLYRLFNSIDFISVEHQANDAKTKKDWIYSFLILVLSPKVVYLSKNYWREIKNKFNRISRGKSIKVVNNGINIRKFKPKTKLIEKGILNFSMISRMTDLRDHHTLIDAFKEVSNNKDYKLFLAGDGHNKRELEAYVAQKNLSSKIIFTGNLNEEQVLSLIHKTDIYIHSSLAETLSTSLLQVMACKVPIIATDIPGINNLLVDGEEALLFKPKNINHLIEKIKCLMSSFEMRNQLALNAYNKIKGKFSSDAMFAKYKSFIQE
jgi:glycosyltransferase involved in cell wall biosynthesis